MKKRILFMANFISSVKEINSDMQQKYTVQLCPFNVQVLLQYMKVVEVDLVIIYLKDVTREQLQVIQFVGRIYEDTSMMIIGSEKEITEFDKIMYRPIERKLLQPVSAEQIMHEVDMYFEREEKLDTELYRHEKKSNSDEEEESEHVEKKHVLVIDDNAQMLRMMKKWLKDKYKVSIVSSGVDALVFLVKHKPDVILLDYDMPLLDGCDVLERIRSNDCMKDIPVFFLTAVSQKEQIFKAIALKPQGYILKTATKKEIIDRLEEFFYNSEAAN